jgi:hypothetical protein
MLQHDAHVFDWALEQVAVEQVLSELRRVIDGEDGEDEVLALIDDAVWGDI